MWSYIAGFFAFLIFGLNPLIQILGPSRQLSRSPRPQLNESLVVTRGPDQPAIECPPDTYSIHILSKSPLVIYIEDFLSTTDRRHLLDISNPIFEPSTITNDGSSVRHDTTVRDSEVALIPRTDPVRCIEARAWAFQGFKDELWIERLRTQRYIPGGHYNHHFDWSSNSGGWGRVSSFMAWVDAEDLEGGGTEFPYLNLGREADPRWCRFIECSPKAAPIETPAGSSATPEGVIFKPIPGNAIFWENFRPDGNGYEETWHAGLRVTKGVKVGLNIWSTGRIE